MRNPFGTGWKKNYLKAIKKAYKNGDISKGAYYELLGELKNGRKEKKNN